MPCYSFRRQNSKFVNTRFCQRPRRGERGNVAHPVGQVRPHLRAARDLGQLGLITIGPGAQTWEPVCHTVHEHSATDKEADMISCNRANQRQHDQQRAFEVISPVRPTLPLRTHSLRVLPRHHGTKGKVRYSQRRRKIGTLT